MTGETISPETGGGGCESGGGLVPKLLIDLAAMGVKGVERLVGVVIGVIKPDSVDSTKENEG